MTAQESIVPAGCLLTMQGLLYCCCVPPVTESRTAADTNGTAEQEDKKTGATHNDRTS